MTTFNDGRPSKSHLLKKRNCFLSQLDCSIATMNQRKLNERGRKGHRYAEIGLFNMIEILSLLTTSNI